MAFSVKDWKNDPDSSTPISAEALEDMEDRLSDYTDTQAIALALVHAYKGKGFVNHGSNASTARPTEYKSIEWFGTVAPNNAIDGDTWVDVS